MKPKKVACHARHDKSLLTSRAKADGHQQFAPWNRKPSLPPSLCRGRHTLRAKSRNKSPKPFCLSALRAAHCDIKGGRAGQFSRAKQDYRAVHAPLSTEGGLVRRPPMLLQSHHHTLRSASNLPDGLLLELGPPEFVISGQQPLSEDPAFDLCPHWSQQTPRNLCILHPCQ